MITGPLLAAYTAEFGLGISATASIEDSSTRRNGLVGRRDQHCMRSAASRGERNLFDRSTICNAQSVPADRCAAPAPPAAAIHGCPIGD